MKLYWAKTLKHSLVIDHKQLLNWWRELIQLYQVERIT